MVFRRGTRQAYYLYFPTRTGWVQRSTGTADRSTARAMERMVEALGPKGSRAWDLLDAVVDGRLPIGRLFDAWRMNALDQLRAELSDVDLETYIPAWYAWLGDRVGRSTREHYEAHLRTLMPAGKPYYRSQLSGPVLSQWVATRTALPQKRRPGARKGRRKENPVPRPVSGSTRRKYLAAVSSFCGYLQELGVLEHNPAAGVKAPPQAPPRLVVIELPEVWQIVEGAADPYRALFALLYGTGIEVSTALRLAFRDVDLPRREIRARGTKTHTRDRIVRVADWAWPFLAPVLRGKLPAASLFPGLDRWDAGHEHRKHLKALGLEHHRLHDARHFYAIRAVRAGTPYELVARQLGHADVTMVAKVYGRFAPGHHDRERWEQIASARDAELYAQGGGPTVATRVASGGAEGAPGVWKDAATDEEGTTSGNSWGRIRTADPGIMSAVL